MNAELVRQDKPPMTVVAGVILRADGMVLIGQRSGREQHGLKWEFPGGKMEAAENPREALARELREELDIEAEVGEELLRYHYSYPGRKPIHLIFFRVDRFRGEPRNRVFEQIRWELPERFPEYDFLDGDIDFVRRLARGEVLNGESSGS